MVMVLHFFFVFAHRGREKRMYGQSRDNQKHFEIDGLPNLLRYGPGGIRLGGEASSPLFVKCVMRRRFGTSIPSTLPVQLMATKNLLSTNQK